MNLTTLLRGWMLISASKTLYNTNALALGQARLCMQLNCRNGQRHRVGDASLCGRVVAFSVALTHGSEKRRMAGSG